ncbi:MAG: DUF72 domain-containing protein [Calditrichaeota bacterium]|nr:MAG: DUF72 domain-containing protein [Calditrichota bacterium]MBL1206778.1 DUF72 domain-containing protein [Calditrichota bacterium]NOG46604.1 DUF72 domain-containing protein [Calditrichota bacterium]
MNYLFGTSGFSYDDWKGNFYPENIKKNEMLSFYSGIFKVVEINVTYYTIPSAASFEKMAAKTEDQFEFIVKVHQETTHRRKENEASINLLVEALRPLSEQKKLAGLLAQFPYSFPNSEINRKYLRKTKDFIKNIPLFVEFRNASWNKSAVKEFLFTNNIGYVNVDEPNLKGLLPQQDWLTSDLGYVRFHGRNEKKWWDGKGSERYEYNYNQDQLKEWLIRISEILKKSYKSYIFFNNHPKGNAPANAQSLQKLVKQYIHK